MESLQDKLAKNELELSKVKENLSNHDKTIQSIASTCCMLGSLWCNAETELSEKIQNLLFPNGILWDKEIGNYRTIDENKALAIIAKLSDSYKNKKEEISFEKSSSVNLCLNLPDYRTFIEDYLKIVEFIEWLKEYYPEKATFLTKKS